MNELKIGICGWGNVETGLYKSIHKNKSQIEVSLSDEKEFAIANVIISK